ncbi:hypothetical protein BC829DRAFT_416796 [Chytridium lagenaria]|nr:hypothetical protein BC829DRAFT_416796 [Chytridium lagenaria]
MPTTGSEIFETYEKEYATLHDSITQKLTQLSPLRLEEVVGEPGARELEEADEIPNGDGAFVTSSSHQILLSPKVKSYKDEIKKAKRDLAKNGVSERDQLLGQSKDPRHHVVDFEGANQDQRGRLLNGTERLQEGSRKLDEAKRLALEAETMGINTLNDLNNQREQILRTRNTLNNADSWVTKSQGG